MRRADVVVIGAGVAGLVAANCLQAAGAKTVVLEARSRVGGRICALFDSGSGQQIEVGGELIGRSHTHMKKWCRKLGLSLITIPAKESPYPDTVILNDRELSHSDFEGNTHDVLQPEDPLEFGIGTLFSVDPSGNLVEFLQPGKGLFTQDNIRIKSDAEKHLGNRRLSISHINHVCLVVEEPNTSHELWQQLLQLARDPRDPEGDWFVAGPRTYIHTAPNPAALNSDPSFVHGINHFAVEVPNVRIAAQEMLGRSQHVFKVVNVIRQDAGDGPGDVSCKFVEISDVGELEENEKRPSFFIRDPDGNTMEFGQAGVGEF